MRTSIGIDIDNGKECLYDLIFFLTFKKDLSIFVTKSVINFYSKDKRRITEVHFSRLQ